MSTLCPEIAWSPWTDGIRAAGELIRVIVRAEFIHFGMGLRLHLTLEGIRWILLGLRLHLGCDLLRRVLASTVGRLQIWEVDRGRGKLRSQTELPEVCALLFMRRRYGGLGRGRTGWGVLLEHCRLG